MTELEVRVVRLESMRVACASGFGEHPEEEAWDTLVTWARSRGQLDALEGVRFFGFNNPEPSPGSPNYGYEQWMTIGPDVEAEGEVEVKEFAGGLYAVATCRLSSIGAAWKQLVAWAEESGHRLGRHQYLEECFDPGVFITQEGGSPSPEAAYGDLEFDLYLPIAG